MVALVFLNWLFQRIKEVAAVRRRAAEKRKAKGRSASLTPTAPRAQHRQAAPEPRSQRVPPPSSYEPEQTPQPTTAQEAPILGELIRHFHEEVANRLAEQKEAARKRRERALQAQQPPTVPTPPPVKTREPEPTASAPPPSQNLQTRRRRKASSANALRKSLGSGSQLRNALILKELLDKPVSMREQSDPGV